MTAAKVRSYTLSDAGRKTIARAQVRRHDRARLIEASASDVIDTQAALEAWEAGLRPLDEEDALVDAYVAALNALAKVLRDGLKNR